MATRVLVLALSSLAIGGCLLRDWGAYEDVPREEPGAPPPSSAPGSASGSSGSSGNPSSNTNTNATPSVMEDFTTIAEKPTVLAADAAGIVFLTQQGSVLTCPHQGCALPGVIASQQHDLRSLSIGYGFVAWTARGDNATRRASRTPGTGVSEQALDDDGVSAVALSPTKLYFSVDGIQPIGPAGVRMCSPGVDCKCTGPQCDFQTYDGFADGRVTELKLDGADAFWLGENSVFGCAIAACDQQVENRTVLASDSVHPFALATDAQHVYWGSSIEGGAVRSIERGGSGGGDAGKPQAKSIATNVGSPSRLAVTTSSIWFTDPTAGTVSRVPKAGGGPAVIVAKDLAAPDGIAVGGGWVYVTCTGDGRIVRWKQD